MKTIPINAHYYCELSFCSFIITHSDRQSPVWVQGCGGNLQGYPFSHDFCTQAAWKERTTSAGRAPLAVMALPQAPHSSCSKRCCWYLYCTFRAFFASLFWSHLEKMFVPNPEMVHKSEMHLPGLPQGMQHCSKGRMWLVSQSPSPSPHFVCDREKTWPEMVLSGRTRYLRYYGGPNHLWERRLTMGQITASLPACPYFPTEPTGKQCPKYR